MERAREAARVKRVAERERAAERARAAADALLVLQAEARGTRYTRRELGQIASNIPPGTPVPGHIPSFKHSKDPPATHDPFAAFSRLELPEGRTCIGGLAAQVAISAAVTTGVPTQFGGYALMRVAAVAPAHVPDTVRLAAPGAPVDLVEARFVGPGSEDIEDAADGVYDLAVDIGEVYAAIRRGRFGEGDLLEDEGAAAPSASAADADGGGAPAVDAALAPLAMRGVDHRLRACVRFRVFQPFSPTAPYTVTPLLSTLDARGAPTVVASTLSTQRLRDLALPHNSEGCVAYEVPGTDGWWHLSVQGVVRPFDYRDPAGVIRHGDGLLAVPLPPGSIGTAAAESKGVEDSPAVGAGAAARGGDSEAYEVPDAEALAAMAARARREGSAVADAGGRRLRVSHGRAFQRGAGKVEIVAVDGDVAHMHGYNRPEVTGESRWTGFRTTESVPPLDGDPRVDAASFMPNEDIALPNEPTAIMTTVTHADRTHPFAVPSTRPNTALDMYYVLITPKGSGNSACCFTTLGHQDAGMFGMKGDALAAIGKLDMNVFRSFAYAQTGEIQEFETAAGIPYWYLRGAYVYVCV